VDELEVLLLCISDDYRKPDDPTAVSLWYVQKSGWMGALTNDQAGRVIQLWNYAPTMNDAIADLHRQYAERRERNERNPSS